MFKGICEICGIKVSPSNKKYCSWECLLKNYKINQQGCWEWQGALTAYGYGQVNRNGKVFLLHRYIYEKYRKKVPAGLCVLHTCDNRKCINPLHLFTGTKKDNTRDMFLKGRNKTPYGEKCSKSKLTMEQVKQIRREHKMHGSIKRLSKEFKISPQSIWMIIVRKNWAHVPEED